MIQLSSISIDKEKCKGCGLCVKACPKKVIEISADESNKSGYFVADPVRMQDCIGCTFCALMCPDVCITVEK
ncbi:MAG: 4Fe-4S binding protein [Clostridiales bacterium]|nr:4Fe-4S binding protein [Clostridiales bacterium]HOB64734.1 4Fe-4S binding protein [Clostridia bacterium]HOK81902.1 4Fe-4S binding protein [Clostridia bacterium]HOL61563.1 4Fe-4S binding protein [Clostridia bacterium]HPO54192.1 4Fe-4S binding protein [Clostridia bacterium]